LNRNTISAFVQQAQQTSDPDEIIFNLINEYDSKMLNCPDVKAGGESQDLACQKLASARESIRKYKVAYLKSKGKLFINE
jgi:hypothetical protein